MATAKLDHVALRVTEYDWYTAFFEEMFDFKMSRSQGEKPRRRIWYQEGIQLIECEDAPTAGNSIDHLSLAVEDIPSVVSQALARGCRPWEKGAHWLILPNGAKLELMQG